MAATASHSDNCHYIATDVAVFVELNLCVSGPYACTASKLVPELRRQISATSLQDAMLTRGAMRLGSTTKVLGERMLKYYSI